MRRAIAVLVIAFAAAAVNAAVVTVDIEAPPADDDDVANNLANPTGEQKWFGDQEHDAGQTFTPTVSGNLNSFSFKLSQGQDVDAADEYMDLRLGTITRPGDVFTFTDTYSEEAHWTMDWAADDWITVTLDTPQALTAGTEYGVITDAQSMGDWHSGIPYRHTSGANYSGGPEYAGGSLITHGGESADYDLIFEADISVPEPASLALLGLAGAFLVNRRRR